MLINELEVSFDEEKNRYYYLLDELFWGALSVADVKE